MDIAERKGFAFRPWLASPDFFSEEAMCLAPGEQS